MRLVAVGELREGDVLGRTAFDASGQILVPAGFRLRKSHLQRLKSTNLGRIPVMDLAPGQDPPGVILRGVVERRIDLKLNSASLPPTAGIIPLWSSDALMDVLAQHRAWKGGEVVTATLTRLHDVLKEVAAQETATMLSLPVQPSDDWTLFGVRCAVLSLILAHEFNYPLRDMMAAASAALIHYVGFTLFDPASRAAEHTESDFDKVIAREYPTFSSLIVRGSDPESELVHRILLQQAERFSGQGFPQGLRGADQPPRPQRRLSASTMLPHSELATVAIAFERLCHDPLTGLNCDPLTCVEEMAGGNEQKFNAFALETLCFQLQRFPVGSRVRIRGNSSGRYLGFSGIVRKSIEKAVGVSVQEIYLTHDPQGQEIEPLHANFSHESQMHLVWH